MTKKLIIIFFLLIPCVFPFLLQADETANKSWQLKAIDTMKYSRDKAQAEMGDELFISTIDTQVKNIKDLGATYVAIGTPYDDQFIPFLRKWVNAARKYDLHVWFRGNFAGWEEWFGYPRIDRNTHIQMTEAFILQNSELFEDRDIFTPCHECENGGPGNPGNGDVEGYRAFLIDEYNVTNKAFKQINRHVTTNYLSMSGGVAQLVMDKQTTRALGGIVTIDHYFKNPEDIVPFVQDLAKRSGGKIVLGELGAPIPDIHGIMSEEDQAQWIGDTLMQIKQLPEIIGMNYWVNVGGSTALWNEDGSRRMAADVIKNFYLDNHSKPIISSPVQTKKPGLVEQISLFLRSQWRSLTSLLHL